MSSGAIYRCLIPTVLSNSSASSLVKKGKSEVFTGLFGTVPLTPIKSVVQYRGVNREHLAKNAVQFFYVCHNRVLLCLFSYWLITFPASFRSKASTTCTSTFLWKRWVFSSIKPGRTSTIFGSVTRIVSFWSSPLQ